MAKSWFERVTDSLVEGARLDEMSETPVHRWDPEGGDAAYAAYQADDRMGAESDDDYTSWPETCEVCGVGMSAPADMCGYCHTAGADDDWRNRADRALSGMTDRENALLECP